MFPAPKGWEEFCLSSFLCCLGWFWYLVVLSRCNSEVKYDSEKHYRDDIIYGPIPTVTTYSETVIAAPNCTWRNYKSQLIFEPRQKPLRFQSTTIIFPKRAKNIYRTTLNYSLGCAKRWFSSSVQLELCEETSPCVIYSETLWSALPLATLWPQGGYGLYRVSSWALIDDDWILMAGEDAILGEAELAGRRLAGHGMVLISERLAYILRRSWRSWSGFYFILFFFPSISTFDLCFRWNQDDRGHHYLLQSFVSSVHVV